MEDFPKHDEFTCKPIQWVTEGAASVFDEEHAFRYEVGRKVRVGTRSTCSILR